MGSFNYKASLDPMNLSGPKDRERAGKRTQADTINATVKEALKEPETIRNSERRPMNLSGAGRGLVSPPTTLIGDEEEEEEEGFSSTAEMLKTFFGWNDKYTTEAKPRDETKGLEVTFDPPPEAHAKGVAAALDQKVHQSLVEPRVSNENPDFKAEGLDIEYSYKDYQKGGSRAISDYNPNYGVTATEAATDFKYITFHHTASSRKTGDDKVVEGGQRMQKYKEDVPKKKNGKIVRDADGNTVFKHRKEDEKGQFGYHFYIGRDLKIRQGAPLNKRVNHIGGTGRYAKEATKEDPTFTLGQAKKLLRSQGNAFNENAIAIGIVAKDNDDIAKEQTALAIKLATALSDTFNINPKNVGGHGHLLHQDREVSEGDKPTHAWKRANNLPLSIDGVVERSLVPRLRPKNFAIEV